jgi:hypothetical protein
MADEEIERRVEPEVEVAYRSALHAAQQVAETYGVVASGTGALAGGLAAAKIAFGSKQQPTEQQPKKD